MALRRPRGTRQGFLLVEALLAMVVIATGLVFISRALSTNLNVVTRLERTERLRRLAESALRAREIEAQQFGTSDAPAGAFDPPDDAYRWAMSLHPVQISLDDQTTVPMLSVTLTVSPTSNDHSLVQLHTLWPTDWVRQ